LIITRKIEKNGIFRKNVKKWKIFKEMERLVYMEMYGKIAKTFKKKFKRGKI